MEVMQHERELLIEYGNQIYQSKMTRGTGGNLSIYNDETGVMAITPSGIPYSMIRPEDIVLMKLDGTIIDGKRKPSSEYPMHAHVYRERPEFKAMIHMHSTYATVLSTLRKPLVAIDYLVAHGGGKDVRVADYASFGTWQLAENALKAMDGRCAVLLSNHGLNVVGKTLDEVFAKAEIIEFCCELYVRALACGEPVVLSDQEMAFIVEEFNHYGQK